ncbi:dnaJ homolog subfamily C member 28 [Cimex lectularius]|uniref:J domain-containing protein n=1 Tax=Cimex lectularius TaxID=79782 RepID=A0A8I6RXK5_CIMLE|nr:dnaJ homolog subfamily C member 28 [Cimex lectularius]XP_014254317.1 dnaJ homolog subfamily C member 28 [Cimex lectularius]
MIFLLRQFPFRQLLVNINFNTQVQRWCNCSEKLFKHCYLVLGIPEGSDQEMVRQAFLDLVKRYHPDSKSPEADPIKFQQIETAYRTLQDHYARKRFNKDECEGEYGLYYKEKDVEEHDIQHTAPQHRQYLSYGGYGSGTPSQRQRQFTQFKVNKAMENVTEYRIKKLNDKYSQDLIAKESLNKKKIKDVRTGFGMDRLVEDLIQESMTRGEFDNLSGAGKPLKGLHSSHNPYVDFVTHKMNQVLIDNGFTPQWITLQKDIREELYKLKESLFKVRGKIGPVPLDKSEEDYWNDEVNKYEDTVKVLNSKIDTYNLVVPILNKQMFHVKLSDEAHKILTEGTPGKRSSGKKAVPYKEEKQNDNTHVLDLLSAIFEKK